MKASTILLIAAGVGVAILVVPRVVRAVSPAVKPAAPQPSPITVAGRALDPTVAGSPAYNTLSGILGGTGVLDFLGSIGASR